MPSFVDIGIEVMQRAAISVPVGIGMTVSTLALPEKTGGVVAKRVRALALPAAVLVFLAALPAFPAADTGAARIGAVGLVVTGLGSAALWTCASRPLAGGVAAIAALTGFVPNVPVTFALNDVAHDLLTAAHVLGMQVWTGGLIVLALAGVLGRIGGPPPDALRATEDWTRIWERFTLVATCAVGVMIVSGTWLAWTHVGTVGQFFTTSYGRHLFVKLVFVLALVLAGAYNMRVLLPEIAEARRRDDHRWAFRLAVEHFPVVVLGEAVLVIAILVMVTFLHGSARAQAGWPAARAFDLTVLGSGVVLTVLVAIALRAGRSRSGAPK